MNNIKGFSLIEGLIAISILMILLASILPIYQLLEREQHRFRHRHLITLALHDDLQTRIWMNSSPVTSYEKLIVTRKVMMEFTKEGEYVKGCAVWQNVQDKREEICLFGIQEE